MFLIVIKVIAFIIFNLASAFTLLAGKNNTGIKFDYAVLSIVLGVVMLL